jgi:hypothetical protein
MIFHVRISYVLRFISIRDLFTDSPSYITAVAGKVSLNLLRNSRRDTSFQSPCTKVVLLPSV